MIEERVANKGVIFPESKLAHEILDGLAGLELGPASHNPFGLNTRSVALTAEQDAQDYETSKRTQLEMCGTVAPIDIPGDAANIPVPNNSTDFVLHSHVWEHLPNPLAALDDWVRVVRPGGFIFGIVPKRDAALNDQERALTSFNELLEHYRRKTAYEDRMWEMKGVPRGHYSVFSPGLLREIGAWFNRHHFWARLDEVAFQETDDKVGNGHTIVWQVKKFPVPFGFATAVRNRMAMRMRREAN
jgi:SAM-dependent methyltransferase